MNTAIPTVLLTQMSRTIRAEGGGGKKERGTETEKGTEIETDTEDTETMTIIQRHPALQ